MSGIWSSVILYSKSANGKFGCYSVLPNWSMNQFSLYPRVICDLCAVVLAGSVQAVKFARFILQKTAQAFRGETW